MAVIIPLSLLATFIGLRIRGIPANLLSLGAMDFGIIVDGAVIVLENVFRHLHGARTSSDQRDRKADRSSTPTAEVGRPTLFSMLVIIIAHLPIFTLQRHEGRIFAPMAYTVVVGADWLAAVLADACPAAVVVFPGGTSPKEENVLVRMCKRAYRAGAAACAEAHVPLCWGSPWWRWPAASRWCRGWAPNSCPELNEGALWINIMLPAGISVTETSRSAGAHPRHRSDSFRRSSRSCPSPAGRRMAPIPR